MSNPRNESGKFGEDRMKKVLIENNLPYTPGKNNGIDFIVHLEKDIYIDIKNQNTDGSVNEKLPHMVWKYKQKYNYSKVYIVEGKKNTPESIKKHCNEICDVYFVKFEEMCDILLGEPTKIERFF
tara:strand:+ start:82 stop:456 length:375 start_codon:yes stop_codon:yes gene_type:complete